MVALETPRPTPATGSVLAPWAQRLGLHTLDDAWAEYRAAKRGWTGGAAYRCLVCGASFASPSGARKHLQGRGHPVLRTDLYAAADLLDVRRLPTPPPIVRARYRPAPAPTTSCTGCGVAVRVANAIVRDGSAWCQRCHEARLEQAHRARMAAAVAVVGRGWAYVG